MNVICRPSGKFSLHNKTSRHRKLLDKWKFDMKSSEKLRHEMLSTIKQEAEPNILRYIVQLDSTASPANYLPIKIQSSVSYIHADNEMQVCVFHRPVRNQNYPAWNYAAYAASLQLACIGYTLKIVL